jgi:hypothetical protein
MKYAGVIVLIAGFAILASWLAAAGGVGPAPVPSSQAQAGRVSVPAGGGTPPAPPGDNPIVTALQARAEQLRTYLAHPPPLRATARNPFRFADRQNAGAIPGRAPSGGAGTPLSEGGSPGNVPVLALVGVAENGGPDGPTRTAIVSGLGQLFLVKEGEEIAGRFKVVRIGPDATSMIDQASGETFVLRLK